MQLRISGLLAAAVVGGVGLAFVAPTAPAAEQTVNYEKDIQPIFKASCIKCHSVSENHKKAASGYDMSTQAGIMKGGSNGKAIVPGDGKNSLLYKLLLGSATVEGEDIEAMPKKKKGEEFKPLPDKQKELIKEWIDQGAKF